MPTVFLSPIGNDAPFVDSNGDPLSGGLLYTHTAGSSTPETTYTTSAGNVGNANPIELLPSGYPGSSGNVLEIWLTSGVSYKFTLKTAAGVTLWTRDNISGVNDSSTSTSSQWVAGPAPTYISATSFSLVGDQTSTFHVGRRIKTTNSGGTVYSTISNSAFAAVTTITVINDGAGVLDSGLSAVSYGLLSATNPSVPVYASLASVAAHATTANIWVANQVVLTGSAVTFTALSAAPFVGAVVWVKQNAAHVWTNGATFSVQGGASYTAAAGDWVRVYATTVSTFEVTIFKVDGNATAYSTGTWTPTLTFATPGDLNVVYSVRVGSYTKIGRLVTANCNITTSTFNHTTASGALQVTGLPFAAKTLTGYSATGPMSFAGLTVTGAFFVGPSIASAASLATFSVTAGGPSTITSVAFGNTTSGTQVILNFSISYEATT